MITADHFQGAQQARYANDCKAVEDLIDAHITNQANAERVIAPMPIGFLPQAIHDTAQRYEDKGGWVVEVQTDPQDHNLVVVLSLPEAS